MPFQLPSAVGVSKSPDWGHFSILPINGFLNLNASQPSQPADVPILIFPQYFPVSTNSTQHFLLSILSNRITKPIVFREVFYFSVVAGVSSSASVAAPSIVLPWQPPTPKVLTNILPRDASEGALARPVEDIGTRLVLKSTGPSASQRLAALALRVRAQAAVSSSSASAADAYDRRTGFPIVLR